MFNSTTIQNYRMPIFKAKGVSFPQNCGRIGSIAHTTGDCFMKSAKYEQANKTLNISEIMDSFIDKQRKLPPAFKLTLSAYGSYLMKGLEVGTLLSENATNISLLKADLLLPEKKSYVKAYKKELGLIDNVSTLCKLYEEAKIKKSEFDSQFEDFIKNFSK